MEIIEKPNLKLSIEALAVGAFIDLPKKDFTASAARKAVQRIKEGCLSEEIANGNNKIGRFIQTSDLMPKEFRVSETAYPGGTRVTRLA